ncbi:hypothetical protein PENTCL1PPCAC_8160, partial [Pristionchus entomophagus]
GFRYTRFIVLAAAVLYLAFMQASVGAFNIVYVVMADQTTSPLYDEYLELVRNQFSISATTLMGSEPELKAASPTSISFDWAPAYLPLSLRRYKFSAMHKSFSFAGSFAGSLFGTFPMMYLLRR